MYTFVNSNVNKILIIDRVHLYRSQVIYPSYDGRNPIAEC